MKSSTQRQQQQQLIDALVCDDRDDIDDTECQQKHSNETIELIEQSLEEFEIELDHQVNIKKLDHGQYYLMAVSVNPSWSLDDTKFRLQFLRTEVFNVTLAVQRFLNYWKNRYELFGPDLAFYHTKQRTMSMMDLESIQAGYCQSVRGHSRILYVDPAGTPKPKYDIDSVVRGIHYCVDAKLRYTPSEETIQKKGIVAIVDFQYIRTFDYALVKRISSTVNDGVPCRTTMTIIINAPPGLSYFVSLFKMFLKPKLRGRIHVMNQYQRKFTQLTGMESYQQLYDSLHHHEWLQSLCDIENAAHDDEVEWSHELNLTNDNDMPLYRNRNNIEYISTEIHC